MGAMLYKEGDEHEIRGVKCVFTIVQHRAINDHLKIGWKTRVEDLYQTPEPTEVEQAPAAAPEPVVSYQPETTPELERYSANPPEQEPQLTNKQWREKARAAGIEGWNNRQVGKLKAEMGYG